MKRILRYYRDYYYNKNEDKVFYHVLDAMTNEIKTVEELKSEVSFYLMQGFKIETINTSFISGKKCCEGPLDLFNYENEFNLVG